MPERKSLCAQLPIALYNQVTEAREALGMTTNEYVTRLITEYFQLKKNGGTIIMASNRTMLKEIFWTIHVDEMANEYGFSTSQRQQLHEQLSEENRGMWTALFSGLGDGDADLWQDRTFEPCPGDIRTCTNRLKPFQKSVKSSNHTNSLGGTERYLAVFGKTAGAAGPGQRALNNPTLGQDFPLRFDAY